MFLLIVFAIGFTTSCSTLKMSDTELEEYLITKGGSACVYYDDENNIVMSTEHFINFTNENEFIKKIETSDNYKNDYLFYPEVSTFGYEFVEGHINYMSDKAGDALNLKIEKGNTGEQRFEVLNTDLSDFSKISNAFAIYKNDKEEKISYYYTLSNAENNLEGEEYFLDNNPLMESVFISEDQGVKYLKAFSDIETLELYSSMDKYVKHNVFDKTFIMMYTSDKNIDDKIFVSALNWID